MKTKKLVVDLRWVRNTNIEGISRYSIEVIKGLLKLNSDNRKPFEIVLLFHQKEIRDFVLKLLGSDEPVAETFMVPFPVLDLREPLSLPNLLAKMETDIFLAMNYLTFPFHKKFRTALVVHDLVQYAFSGSNEANFRWKIFFKFKFQTEYVLKKADLIFADSISTKEDLKRIFNAQEKKISVIYPGIEQKFFEIVSEEDKIRVLKKYDLPEKFILSVSRQEPRKNLATLIESYSSLPEPIKEKYKLVLAGKKHPKFFPELDSMAKQLNTEVFFPGYIDENDLPALYQTSSVVVYPTLYEGFGFPVLEAMASEVAVVTSNVSSIPEIAGPGTILIDPAKSANITKAIETALEHTNQDQLDGSRAKAADFTWEKTSSQLFKSLLKLANQ